jgi:starch synthase
MADNRIIYVSQEIAPYLQHSENARLDRELPQEMQELKYEVRTFMPDFGTINERRNQLHEVIRLSGVNIPIRDNDHPLIVKVASMQPSRIQVYFIDSDDYFQKQDSDADPFGSNRTDNDERMIFYAHGTMTTAKKLQWDPDVVHVTGWMSTLVPLYLKRLFSDGPSFHHTKVIYTVGPETEIAPLDPDFFEKLKAEGVRKTDLKSFAEMDLNQKLLHKMAINWSDGLVFRGIEPDPELVEFAEAAKVPWIQIDGETAHGKELNEFYKSVPLRKP